MGNLCWKAKNSSKTKKSKDSLISKYGDVVIMGAENVGKTAITNRLVYNYYTEQYIPTSTEIRYDVDALLEMADDGEVESARQNMILKRSFRSSEAGVHRPAVQKRQTIKTSVRRVLTTNTK